MTAIVDRETGLPLAVSFYGEPPAPGEEEQPQPQQQGPARVEYYRDVRLGAPVDPGLFEIPNYCLTAPEDEVRCLCCVV